MTFEEFKAFTETEVWTFAKTYADKAPHEYIVMKRTISPDEMYFEAVKYIQEEGIQMHFWNLVNNYVFCKEQGKYYWVMCNGKGVPLVINRANIDDYKISVKWRGPTT